MMLYIDKRPDANLFKLLATNMYPFPHKKDTEALNMQPVALFDISDNEPVYLWMQYRFQLSIVGSVHIIIFEFQFK